MTAPQIREHVPLRREVGLPGAVLLGLGSIVGTGVFVSIGVAAAIAGPAVLLAIGGAALLATLNGLSSARLAATFPVSGGTSEYAHLVLDPRLGFLAGWTFLCAKTASAATAALGCAGYLLSAAGAPADGAVRVGLALALALAITVLVLGGLRRSNQANAVLVTVTLATLVAFVAVGLARARVARPFDPLLPPTGLLGLLEATALMFVAFTGYGRIATLGEEVRDPARTIPRAVVVTLIISAALYLAVAAAGLRWVGADGLAHARAGATLAAIAREERVAWLATLLGIGAITAMGGVLVNLVLGLSRVALAMARRGDLPARLTAVDGRGSPRAAVLACGATIAALTLVGDVKATWSFSAFTVLVYYAVTNLAALRLPAADLRLPRVVPLAGLLVCLGLAFFVEPRAWVVGLGLIAVGFLARAIGRRT